MVIFVKSVQRCVALAQLLTEQNFPAIAIHRGMTQEERLSRYQQFKDFQKVTIVLSLVVLLILIIKVFVIMFCFLFGPPRKCFPIRLVYVHLKYFGFFKLFQVSLKLNNSVNFICFSAHSGCYQLVRARHGHRAREHRLQLRHAGRHRHLPSSSRQSRKIRHKGDKFVIFSCVFINPSTCVK